MKKSRRLLHQFNSLIVSLVIVGSSVFFCAPMDVEAAESLTVLGNDVIEINDVASEIELNDLVTSSSGSVITTGTYYISDIQKYGSYLDFATCLDSVALYEVNYTVNINVDFSTAVTVYGLTVGYGDEILYSALAPGSWESTTLSVTRTATDYFKGCDISGQRC